jgi:threonine/homoserine/homoserine lactone efflux protein
MALHEPMVKEERSLGELFAELTQEATTLVRQEVALAKTELSQKASRMGKDAGLVAAGGAVAYAGLLAIIAAVIILLAAAGLPWWASALLVGIVVVGSGAFLAWKGLQALKTEDLTPRETIATLKGDKTWIRQQTR